MLKKPFKAVAVAAFAVAAIAPVAVSSVEAASAKIVDVVVEKDGKYYSIDIQTYYALKGAGHSILQDIKLMHVYSSNGDTYPVRTYQDAQAAGGNMAAAFEYLAGKGLEVELSIGKIEFPPNGQPPIFTEGDSEAEVVEFKVVDIQ